MGEYFLDILQEHWDVKQGENEQGPAGGFDQASSTFILQLLHIYWYQYQFQYQDIVSKYCQILLPVLSSSSAHEDGTQGWCGRQGFFFTFSHISDHFLRFCDHFSYFFSFLFSQIEDGVGAQGWSGQAGGNCWHLLPLKSNFHPIASILNFCNVAGKGKQKSNANVILTFLNADFQMKKRN